MDQLKKRKQGPIDPGVGVVRPTELLHQFGVTSPDGVPVQPDRFSSYMEIFQIQDRVLKGEFKAETLTSDEG